MSVNLGWAVAQGSTELRGYQSSVFLVWHTCAAPLPQSGIYYQRDFQAVFFEVFPNMSSMVTLQQSPCGCLSPMSEVKTSRSGEERKLNLSWLSWFAEAWVLSSQVADGLFFCVLVFTGSGLGMCGRAEVHRSDEPEPPGALQMVVLWRAARERKASAALHGHQAGLVVPESKVAGRGLWLDHRTKR